MNKTLSHPNKKTRIIRTYEKMKEKVIVSISSTSSDGIKKLNWKLCDSAIYVASFEDILATIMTWNDSDIEIIAEEIESWEKDKDRQVDTISSVSFPNIISKKIFDDNVLLTFQQKYSWLSDNANIHSITSKMYSDLVIMDDSSNIRERSRNKADRPQHEWEEEN